MRLGTFVRRAGGLGGAVAVLALLAGGAAEASAADCDGGFIGGGPTVWDVAGDDGEFTDSTLYRLGGADATRDDAFDDYGQVEIDGTDYENPNEAGCTYPAGDREALFPADVINDVAVRPQLYVNKGKPFGRQFVSLRNTTGAPVTVEFAWDGNLGSDTATAVATTTSGDISMNQGDRWGTTCEDGDDDGCGDVVDEAERDPELAHNWEGKGVAGNSADLVFDPELNDGDLRFQFDDVTIGAGKTVTFMQIVSLAPTINAANKAAKKIDKNPQKYGVFAGLSKKERKRLRNW